MLSNLTSDVAILDWELGAIAVIAVLKFIIGLVRRSP